MKKKNQKNTYGCTLSNLFIGCRAQGFFDFLFFIYVSAFLQRDQPISDRSNENGDKNIELYLPERG